MKTNLYPILKNCISMFVKFSCGWVVHGLIRLIRQLWAMRSKFSQLHVPEMSTKIKEIVCSTHLSVRHQQKNELRVLDVLSFLLIFWLNTRKMTSGQPFEWKARVKNKTKAYLPVQLIAHLAAYQTLYFGSIVLRVRNDLGSTNPIISNE